MGTATAASSCTTAATTSPGGSWSASGTRRRSAGRSGPSLGGVAARTWVGTVLGDEASDGNHTMDMRFIGLCEEGGWSISRARVSLKSRCICRRVGGRMLYQRGRVSMWPTHTQDPDTISWRGDHHQHHHHSPLSIISMTILPSLPNFAVSLFFPPRPRFRRILGRRRRGRGRSPSLRLQHLPPGLRSSGGDPLRALLLRTVRSGPLQDRPQVCHVPGAHDGHLQPGQEDPSQHGGPSVPTHASGCESVDA